MEIRLKDEFSEAVMRNIRRYWMNRSPVKYSTIFVLCAAALLVACDRDEATGPGASSSPEKFQADLVGSTLSYITGRLLALLPLIPDGSQTTDEPPAPGHTIHVVDRDNKDSWKIQVGSTEEVTFDDEVTCGPTPPPQPTGALHLVVTTGDQGARLRSTRYHRTYLRDLTRLDYWACDEVNNGQQWPYILLNIDWDGDNVIDDNLIFEPAYQNPVDGGQCGIGSAQARPVLQDWHFWDALRKDPANGTFRACWWSTCMFETPPPAGCVPFFPPGDVIRSLEEYITAHQNAAIVNVDGNHGGVQIVHGFASPGDLYDGWVDAFTIGKDLNKTNSQSNSTITYDFEKP
jgi:hypothetical protein